MDTTQLFGQLTNEPKVPRSAVLVLENFLFELLDRNIVGLPRGVPLIRNPQALMRAFVNDMKVACTNASAGYEDISPYIIGSISATIENLIGTFKYARGVNNSRKGLI